MANVVKPAVKKPVVVAKTATAAPAAKPVVKAPAKPAVAAAKPTVKAPVAAAKPVVKAPAKPAVKAPGKEVAAAEDKKNVVKAVAKQSPIGKAAKATKKASAGKGGRKAKAKEVTSTFTWDDLARATMEEFNALGISTKFNTQDETLALSLDTTKKLLNINKEQVIKALKEQGFKAVSYGNEGRFKLKEYPARLYDPNNLNVGMGMDSDEAVEALLQQPHSDAVLKLTIVKGETTHGTITKGEGDNLIFVPVGEDAGTELIDVVTPASIDDAAEAKFGTRVSTQVSGIKTKNEQPAHLKRALLAKQGVEVEDEENTQEEPTDETEEAAAEEE